MGDVTPAAPPRYRKVGRYRVYSELASGGMATVHLGCLLGPAGFSKLVAIKCLHEEFALEKEFVSMFLDEARLASSIHHPNVVASLDVVAEQGELMVVMEYVHGETLATLLRTSRQTGDAPSLPVVIRVMCDVLEGLHAAHVASLAGQCLNIVHRDVSPQNIMVGADGNTRVLDFGIAQAALRSQVTAAGTVKGKVAYMSPEQVQGQGVDARTDIFAAGVVLWEALTRQRLFFAADSRDIVSLLLSSPIPAPSAIVPSLGPELDRVVLKALERDRERRYQSAHEFAEALRRAASEGSRREVADWVGHVAKDGLARRLDLLQALEASAIHTRAAVSLPVVVTGSSPRAAAVPTVDVTQTRATSATSIMPQGQRPDRRRPAAWLVALAGVALAIAAWVLVARPPALEATSAAPKRAPATTVHAASPPPPPAVTSETQPPTLAAESLPLAPAVAESSSSSAVVAPPPITVPAPMPSASSVKRTTTKPTMRLPAPGPAAAPAIKSCSPPYRIDASGVRRVKPECL